MNLIHAEELQDAIEMIAEDGREVVLISRTFTSNGRERTSVDTESPVIALQTAFKQSEIDGTLVMQNDIRYLIAADIAINDTMKIKDQGRELSITNVVTLAPADVPILHKVQARA